MCVINTDKLHQILSSLWKNDNSKGKSFYNQALQDVQTAIELCEERVSGDIGKAGKEWLMPQLDKSYANYGETKMMELTHFDGYAMLDAVEFGAKWMEEQGVTVEGLVICSEILTQGYKDIVMEIPDSLKVGDKVTVQIRKRD